MTKLPPLIGFDRFVEIEWIQAALSHSDSEEPVELLQQLISPSFTGKESLRKTIDIIKRLSFAPFPRNSTHIIRGVELFQKLGSAHTPVLTWGAALSTYPFFGKVAEVTGRLLSLNDDCAISDVQRRVAENYGDRHGIERAASRILQSLIQWRMLSKSTDGKRISKNTRINIENDAIALWLVEALIINQAKPISISRINLMPELFPFHIQSPVQYLASRSSTLRLMNDGANEMYVGLSQ